MVFELFCSSFCGDAAALVERFVEDAFSSKRAAVFTWGNSRTLVKVNLFRNEKKKKRGHALRFDFLHAKHAVETLFFQPGTRFLPRLVGATPLV